MISRLMIKNFKSIENVDIKFKRLNVLCGENASGKTSVIHAILLCSQNNAKSKNADGEIIKIGNYDELKNSKKKGEIKITLKNADTTKTITYKRNEDLSSNQDNILDVEDTKQNSFKFEKELFYLSSNRTGVEDTYKQGNYLFGPDGAGAIPFLYNHQEELLAMNYMQYFNERYKNTAMAENRKFIEHVRFWMEYIINEKISISSIERTNQYVLSYGINRVRPINTGSGYSFLLPIVIVCLGAILLGEETPTVIIENPEIFLHPEAQQRLMEFLNFCKRFCQIIIETHSEYIIKHSLQENRSALIVVFNKNEKDFTQKTVYNAKNFKTGSYLEILYRAFGIVVPEFHILLYGMVQEKYNKANNKLESSLFDFDRFLSSFTDVKKKSWTHKNRDGSDTIYNTLSTYIRNKIDHPEAKDPKNNKIYAKYSALELKQSIEFLLRLL